MSATNLAKVPLYFGAPERPLFGFYHPPAGSRVRATGVLLCNPLGDDLIRAHRPFRHLAEELSAAGFPFFASTSTEQAIRRATSAIRTAWRPGAPTSAALPPSCAPAAASNGWRWSV